MTEASRFYALPSSTVAIWNERTQKHLSSVKGASLDRKREKVVKYANKYSVDQACSRFKISKASISRWRRQYREENGTGKKSQKEASKTRDENDSPLNHRKLRSGIIWDTRDKIVKHARKHKNLQQTSRKFGVSVAQVKRWMTKYQEKEEVEDSKEDHKRVKEYPNDIKEAAVEFGHEHGWTAAAEKYGTSPTSVSR